jgi:uncharacterized protein YjdB
MIMNKTVKTLLLSIMLTAFFCGCGVEFWHPDYDPSDNGGRVSVTDVYLDKGNMYLTVGSTETLTVTVIPDNATNKRVTWISDDPYIATVSQSGTVTGISEGITFITVTTLDGGKRRSCYVNVRYSVNLTPVASDYDIYGTGNNTYTGSPIIVSILPKSGKSSGAITILYNGSSTAPTAEGIYTVTFNVEATSDWNAAYDLYAGTLIISSSSIPVTSVSLNKSTLSLEVGDIETLIPTVSPSNATNKNVSWSSSVPSVATVLSNGLVTAVSAGSATIAVTTADGNFSATCTVTVSTSNSIFASGLSSHLASLPPNTVSSPHNIVLKVRNTEEFEIIKAALNGAPNKYVYLDLSGSTITEIPDFAFNTTSQSWKGCETIIGITIPNGVTRIGVDALYGCFNLANVSIPNSVTSIGNCALYHCNNLANVSIPNSVTSIGAQAFARCDSLSSITIPYSVNFIGKEAFTWCDKLFTINVDSGNNAYTSEDGVLYSKDKKTLIAYPGGKIGAFTIPSGVTSIGDSAFQECRNISNVTIPNTVTIIGEGAFLLCDNIASVTIPASVTSIKGHAFYNCYSLISVTFQGTIPLSGFYTEYTFYGDLRAKFYALNPSNGMPGTYTTSNPDDDAIWTRQ